MCSSSPPPAPDYRAAAEETAESNREALTQQTFANRPNQNTPFGSTFWTTGTQVDPATGQPVTSWTQNQTLDPSIQAALNEQLAIQSGRSQLAGGFMGRVADEYSQPFNWQNLPGMAGTPQQQFTQGRYLQTGVPVYGLDTANPQQTTFARGEPGFVQERQRIEQGLFERMQPEHQRQQAALETQLANAGLTAGSEGYREEMKRLSDQQARERFNALEMGGQEQQRLQNMMLGQQQQAFGQDVAAQQAYNQALAQQQAQYGTAGQFFNQAQQAMFGQDIAANQQNYQQMMAAAEYQNRLRQQAIAEQAMSRGMSLNELNALLTGQQVTTPQMPSYMGSGVAPGANYSGAAAAQYGAGMDAFSAQQAQNQGIQSGLFSLGAAAIFM